MAAKKTEKPARASRPGPAKGTGGRPIKGDTAAVHIMSLRFSKSDWSMLEDLVEDQGQKVAALGVTSFSASDMVRMLVREEHRRRGLDGAG